MSNDVNIGDVCRTGEIVDLLDNAKITDVTAAPAKAKAAQRRGTKPVSGHEVSFSPTHYETSVEVSVALDLDRLLPERKSGYEQWAAKREAVAKEHIPSEFTGKDGKKELIAAPVVRSGLIACAAVSGSTDYNKNIRKLDRKILAIETKSGGMFSVAKRLSVPALTIRGISDYAGFGIDKNQFERETNNKARLVAVLNAASYLYQQIPTANFLRMTLASHLISRVYWNHWDKENRLKLLHAAQECLKSSGLQYDKAGLKRLIEREKGEED